MKTDDDGNDRSDDRSGRASRRVGVLMGGLSAEREVSLATGAGVLAALRERGYHCVAIDWAPGTSLPALLAEHRVDVVWNALHGVLGEDGAVQGMCACVAIPCTGSGILASALAMDKVMAKRIFESSDVPTPRWTVLAHTDGADRALRDWSLPFVVKPSGEGSSVGVSIVRNTADIAAAVAGAAAHTGSVLVEEYIPGVELHVGILDDAVLGSVEVRPASGFYDYQAKYKRDDTQYLIPTSLAPGPLQRAEARSLAAYRALGCSGYGRVDIRVDDREGRTGQPYILEVNTLPGMTSHSLLPKIAAHAGIDYPTLCERILASAR